MVKILTGGINISVCNYCHALWQEIYQTIAILLLSGGRLLSYKYDHRWSSLVCMAGPNQKFIVVVTLRMVGNCWLWSIMLGNANEASKSRVGYSRLPTEFFILETQLQETMIIAGISKCTQHVCERGRNPAIFDDSQLLADYHWYFHAYPMILSVDATDYLNFKNKCTHTHAHALALETIYSIIFQQNEIF